MGSSRFALIALIRLIALALTIAAAAFVATNTGWFAVLAILATAVVVQWFGLLRFVNTSNREIGRFLSAIEYEDLTQTFTDRGLGGTFRELGQGLNRVMERLRTSRNEREEQAHYLRALVEHIPVALIALESGGRMAVLNSAARRLLGVGRFETVGDLAKRGTAFADGLAALGPGKSGLVKLTRAGGETQVKAAATQVTVGGVTRRLISLLSIESELNEHELAAWQALIRVLTHEMMNSLTPVSSLAGTAHEVVRALHEALPEGSELQSAVADAREATEAVARRSAGLLQFVQSYRRLTKDLVPNLTPISLTRVFARLERLMAPELARRGIAFSAAVDPVSLEITADGELLDQALINLIRNATDALAGRKDGRIEVTARIDEGGFAALAVADNGPGIAADIRDKIYIPFYTTKRTGSGVGLSLSRQIALVHGGSIQVSDTPGGGATVTLRLR